MKTAVSLAALALLASACVNAPTQERQPLSIGMFTIAKPAQVPPGAPSPPIAVMIDPVSKAVAESECAPLTVSPSGQIISDPIYTNAVKSKRLARRRLGDDGAYYPPALQRRGVEGLVFVAFDVETDGAITNVRVLRANPPDVFDGAAIRVARSHKFEPLEKRCAGMVEAVRFRLR